MIPSTEATEWLIPKLRSSSERLVRKRFPPAAHAIFNDPRQSNIADIMRDGIDEVIASGADFTRENDHVPEIFEQPH
jgi:hypothetical protein